MRGGFATGLASAGVSPSRPANIRRLILLIVTLITKPKRQRPLGPAEVAPLGTASVDMASMSRQPAVAAGGTWFVDMFEETVEVSGYLRSRFPGLTDEQIAAELSDLTVSLRLPTAVDTRATLGGGHL